MIGLIFGTQLPQGFFGELDHLEPAERWPAVVQFAQRVEELGFRAVYACDHLLPGAGHAPGAFAAADGGEGHEPILEGWTTLVGISQHTTRLRLGQLVMAVGFRNPALVAKMVATLDVISGGRAEVGIGAGWLEREFDAYGYGFPGPGQRIDMVSEAIDVMRALWSDDRADYDGEHYQLRAARCDPKPLQAHVPVLVGAFGQRSIGVVADKGDRCNFIGTPRQYAKRLRWLEDHCREIGRDVDTIDRTWLNNGVLLAETERDVAEQEAELRRDRPSSATYLELATTVEAMCERLDEYVALGVSEVIVRFCDDLSMRSIELFASHVMPQYSGGQGPT